jgi:hypothetical protein
MPTTEKLLIMIESPKASTRYEAVVNNRRMITGIYQDCLTELNDSLKREGCHVWS